MGKFGDALANSFAGSIPGAILGIGMGAINDKRQIKQQEKLQALQIAGSKELTDYQMMKQLQMWKDTSYPAQIELMKKAGINPALMYGMGGGGGQSTGGAAANVTGATATQAAGGELMGMQLIGAQRELIKAQTENVKANTEKTSGVDTQLTTKQIDSLTQGIENQKAVEELTKIQTEIAQVENHIKGATQNAAIALIMQELRSSYEKMEMIKNEASISDATMDDKIKIVEQELVGAYARNELTRAQTGKTTEETAQLAKTIALEYSKLKNETDKTKIQQQLANFETSFGRQASQILGTILGAKR